MSYRDTLKARLSHEYKNELSIIRGFNYIKSYLNTLLYELKEMLEVTEDVKITNYKVAIKTLQLSFEQKGSSICVYRDDLETSTSKLLDTLSPNHNGVLESQTTFEPISEKLIDRYLERTFG